MQNPPAIDELLAQLAQFGQELERDLSDPTIDWQCRPAEGEWCLTEVACHLRDVELEVHQPRFRALLRADNAFLSGAVADSWVEERRYREQSGPAALADFSAARRETAAMLADLDMALWQRTGQHAFFGPTTLHELLYLVVQHDEAHWEQIQELLSL
jgi:hypothetical protein